LPQTLIIPRVMTLTTLADVRKLMQHLPAGHRELPRWQDVAAELDKAAAGADVVDVAIALRLVLMLEHVECHLK
jgi:2-keto-3-deoxy-L-rhamnonate aldolase RhmA